MHVNKKNDDMIGLIAERPAWMTYLSLLARSFHQVGAAVFLAVYLLGLNPSTGTSYLILAALSGFLLMGVEAIRHRQLLREVSGLTTMLKLIFIGLAFHAYLPPATTITVTFFVASFIAHAPKRIRHKLLF